MKCTHFFLFFSLFATLLFSEPNRLAITDGTITPLATSTQDGGVSKLYKGGKLPVLSAGVYRFTSHFAMPKAITYPTLFLGAMYYPCAISLNGHTIYRWGTLDGKGGMVNYRSSAILLIQQELKSQNTLTIDFWTDGLTMGLPDLWIASNQEVTFETELYNAANVTGTRIGVFLSFLVFFFSIIALFFTKEHKFKTFNFAFFALMTTLTFHMFLFNSSSVDHVLQTKIFRSATLLMGLALFYLISDLTLQQKISKLKTFLFLIHLPLLYFIWNSESKFEIEAIVSKAIPMVTAPILLLVLVTCIMAIKRSRSADNWLILANVLVIFYATYNDLSSLGRKTLPDIWMIPYAYILMTLTGVTVLIMRQMKIYAENTKNRIELEVLNLKLKTANQDTELAREQAVHESDARESFYKTIAHELRTPLTGLLGGVNAVAEDEHIPLHLKKPIYHMKSSFHRLFVTVTNLFDFVEIKRGSIAIVPHPFRIAETLDPVLEFYRDTARANGISFIVLQSKNIPEELYGDSEHLLQVIDNLISNAIKFTTAGGVSCEIGYEIDRLVVTIKDTGVGIAEEKQEAMFKAFSRGEEFSFSQRYEGVGLGLAIVDAVIRAMNGTLKFSSVHNKGTMFSISIPLITANNRHIEFATRKRVLVVEDNSINSLVVLKQLESGKFIADPVYNGKEAVEMCKKTVYDAILMDIQMPVMDGITATKEIRKFNIKTPIIALTANGDRTQCFRAGMNEVLMKPISPSKLISIVSTLIHKAETENYK